MNVKLVFSLLLCYSIACVTANSQASGFDRSAYYRAIEFGTRDDIDLQLASVKGSQVPGKEAYEGALLMKKAGLVAKAPSVKSIDEQVDN